MKMSKPASLVETYKMTLAGSGTKGTLTLEWEKRFGECEYHGQVRIG